MAQKAENGSRVFGRTWDSETPSSLTSYSSPIIMQQVTCRLQRLQSRSPHQPWWRNITLLWRQWGRTVVLSTPFSSSIVRIVSPFAPVCKWNKSTISQLLCCLRRSTAFQSRTTQTQPLIFMSSCSGHATVKKLLVRQVLNQVSAVANWPCDKIVL